MKLLVDAACPKEDCRERLRPAGIAENWAGYHSRSEYGELWARNVRDENGFCSEAYTWITSEVDRRPQLEGMHLLREMKKGWKPMSRLSSEKREKLPTGKPLSFFQLGHLGKTYQLSDPADEGGILPYEQSIYREGDSIEVIRRRQILWVALCPPQEDLESQPNKVPRRLGLPWKPSVVFCIECNVQSVPAYRPTLFDGLHRDSVWLANPTSLEKEPFGYTRDLRTGEAAIPELILGLDNGSESRFTARCVGETTEDFSEPPCLRAQRGTTPQSQP